MSNVSAIGGAIDAIGALNVATKITTVIALAALAVIVAFLLSSQWLSGRRAQIERAIDKGDDDALAALLGHVDVPLDSLTREQKYALGREQSRQRFWSKMVWQALLFAGFLALLFFAWALVQPKAPAQPTAGERISVAQMTKLLTFIPEDQRQEMCAKTLDAAVCAEIVASIEGLTRGTVQEKQAAATVIDRGIVTPTLAVALKNLKPIRVATGSAHGWDIVVRWCGGLNARSNRARAMATAQALGTVVGGRIAPGVTLGAIDVAQTDRRPGGGAYIAADAGAGEAQAAAAIRVALAERGIDRYGVQQAVTATKWRIELYECESTIGIRKGEAL
jgi:hypothetical protein